MHQPVEVAEEPISGVAELGQVSTAFPVESVFHASGGWDADPVQLTEVAVPETWIKDYDTSGGPATWETRFEMANWGLITARAAGRLVGGAVVVADTEAVDLLQGRRDMAALWDIRVAPEWRTAGIGSRLFAAVEGWAIERRCSTLTIETQNINVGACRFYQRMGCTLGAVDPAAYPELPDEVQLLWFKALPPAPAGAREIRSNASP